MDMVCASLAFIDGLGAPEMMLIFILVLVLFGGDKLPAFARSIGKTLREFKKAAAGVEEEFKRALDEDERKQTQLKLTETATANPADPTLALNEPANHDTTHDHYDHDYHAHETASETSTAIDVTSTPVAPASDPTTVTEAGPMAPAANVENTILPPASPAVPTSTPAPTPAAAPAPNPPPAGDRNPHP